MPYIPDTERLNFDIGSGDFHKSGELNYYLSMVCKEYLKQRGMSYSTINDIIGALEGAKLEFYRRMAAPYENDKIEQNGDVY